VEGNDITRTWLKSSISNLIGVNSWIVACVKNKVDFEDFGRICVEKSDVELLLPSTVRLNSTYALSKKRGYYRNPLLFSIMARYPGSSVTMLYADPLVYSTDIEDTCFKGGTIVEVHVCRNGIRDVSTKYKAGQYVELAV
jgi:hypothetical protein